MDAYGRIGKSRKKLSGGLRPLGPMFNLGDRFDRLSYSGGGFPSPEDALGRYSLTWIAGQRGIPSVNATATSAAIDPEMELLGTNATDGDAIINPEGGIIMETDGANDDSIILLPHLTAAESAWTGVTWGTDQETRWGCRIKSGSGIANQIIWAGLKLTNTDVEITDADQAYFRYEDSINGARWQFIVSNTGVDVVYDTSIPVALSTDYELRIELDASRRVRGYIAIGSDKVYDVLRHADPNGGATVMKDATDLIPYIGIACDTTGAAAVHLIVRSQSISRKYA